MEARLSASVFPRLPLVIGFSLVGLALAGAVAGRLTGAGAAAPDRTTAQAVRRLTFADQADGSVLIRDADTGRVIEVAKGENGFLRGTMRGFARARRLAGTEDDSSPFRLTGFADGRLMLEDPTTGRHTDLEAFGGDNEAVFVRLLTEPERSAP